MDPYVYEGTSVLKNNFGITNQKSFDDAEADYTSLRLRELAEHPLPGKYDVEHFYEMHRYIFQDIFDWAGTARKVDIYKEEPILGGLSIEYSDWRKIKSDLSKALGRIKDINWDDRTNSLVDALSEMIAGVWKVHAFREGNTRTTITFFCQLIDEKFRKADRTIFEKNAAYARTALVAYCANFGTEGDYSKKEYLKRIVADAIGFNV